MRREVTYMDKLKITVVSEEAIMESMAGCGIFNIVIMQN